MKKQKKTYGIKGFMEYQAVIKVGRSNMKVNFTDGSMSAMGINPASFTTDKLFVQHAIENSADFKRGLIYLVSTIDLGEDVEIVKSEVVGQSDEVRGQSDEVRGQSDDVGGQGDEVQVEMTEVEFASNDEAKDYLEQNFGLVRSKLRNRESIVEAGRTHGVKIIFV